jgi:8-oxo-dGTP pyrophosphatase MutT (NUDIX family)
MLPHQSASREAYEEAGVIGVISFEPVGIYRQLKQAGDDPTAIISVRAFPLPVSSELQIWPEMQDRERKWFALNEALNVVADREIRNLLEAFRSSLP